MAERESEAFLCLRRSVGAVLYATDIARAYIAQHAPDIAERWYISFLESLLALEENPSGRPLAPENAAFPFDLHQFIFRSKT